MSKSAKKQWGFDGFKKWKKNDSDDETAPLPLNNERSDSESYLGSCHLVDTPIGEGPDTKLIKRKLHSNGSPSDFFIDKVNLTLLSIFLHFLLELNNGSCYVCVFSGFRGQDKEGTDKNSNRTLHHKPQSQILVSIFL